ncbi:hypothetical protein F5Y15DRAFT_214276 [Xylariaceae sp. FL0016]|nr:hypothetical protein F5Y15DRAFT_214276 [Xylariaceae sp. FL0016]
MPFLRRRGVMASENDMRRHTQVLNPDSEAPKPQPDAFLRPDAAVSSDRDKRDDSQDPKSSMESTALAATPTRESQDPSDRPDSPPIQEETPKHRRFSMLRFRNASDSQLSTRLKRDQQQEKPPPMPQPPSIITTAPTIDSTSSSKKSKIRMPMRMRRSSDIPRAEPEQPLPKLKLPSNTTKKDKRKTLMPRASSSFSRQTVTFDESHRPSTSTATSPILEDPIAALTPPPNRLSDSSRSESSIAENSVPTQSTTSSSNSFFRLGRRKQKQPEPLFPMAHLPQKSKTPALTTTTSNTSSLPRQSTSTTHLPGSARPSTGNDRTTPIASPGHGPSNPGRAAGSPATALFRPSSRNSGQSSPTRARLGLRGRSSTLSSLGRGSLEDPQHAGAARTSSSTGRKSFGDLLGLSRMRQNPDLLRQGSLTPATPGSSTSKNNSLQLARETIALPERKDDESAAKYLARLEEVATRGVIAALLSKETDQFYNKVLQSYMRTFSFFEEPMDMAIRKLLMEAELPKETQQIDRCLQAFANRYHECNPGIYSTPDQAYFIAFSLLILHTDVFNKNNKYKMQKADYLKNTGGEGIFDDVLGCFYDNISYTPFIHVEDDFQSNGDRAGSLRAKKKKSIPNGTVEPQKRSKDPIDPYTLILDGKLDILRPPLKDQIPLEEHYSYLGTANRLNLKELQRTFFKTGVLQIVSSRSRPDAFMTEKTQNNPQEAHPGIVDIKVTKVGLLWRKDAKKTRTRSPWQEWGAILTGAQLYFFRNTAWIKNLMHQYETHVKSGHDGVPLIFNPPLEHFKPDALMSTEGAVALWDTTYKKHKNAFVYVRHGGLEEVLLAQAEDDRNDWLAKLNYAAAFRTSGVRMRGVIGGNYEGQSRRALRRLDNSDATQMVQTPTGDVTITRSKIDHQMARDILVARRDFMRAKIEEAEDKLQVAQKQLDNQLRNARHLLLLAPIQERTREQVRGGASKVIAHLKWSRTEICRLKCHRDVLSLDLAEEKDVNGDLEDITTGATSSPKSKPQHLMHKSSRGSSQLTSHQSAQSPAPLPISPSSEYVKEDGGDSPTGEVFQTPPTSATAPVFRDIASLSLDDQGARRTSISSGTSSNKLGTVSPAQNYASTPPPQGDQSAIDEQAEEDARERQVLEQAGLLNVEPTQSVDRPPSSSGNNIDDTPKKSSIAGSADKDRHDRGIRRSLQRTLRDGAGHLSHHRSRKGKDSASSGGLSDDTVRDEILSRGTGSFTVHGKKASVVNFGHELEGMSPEERIRHRKQAQIGEESIASPSSTPDDFHSVLGDASDRAGRRGSVESASTATARSFRELHRKYSSSRGPKSAVRGSLTVPSDEDSDAAISFSEGRRSPLPPLDDEDEGPYTGQTRQAQFYTPEQPGSPVSASAIEASDVGNEDVPNDVERLPSPAVQDVRA